MTIVDNLEKNSLYLEQMVNELDELTKELGGEQS